ncbi:MAG: ATP-dependent helicase [Andreesenia angusta]|nr:ATP-dependent helicase [Andreesenia angusta]
MSKNFFNKIIEDLDLKLDKNQKEAVTHSTGPALVLAVPGAGKTTVLISRIAYLIKCLSIKEESILSITFSRASARDMKERFQNTYGNKYGLNAKFSTIHSFSYRVLRDYFRKNGLKYTLIESSREYNKNNILRRIHDEINNFKLSDDKLDELNNLIGYIKNMMIEPEDYKTNTIKNFVKVYRAFEKYKEENNLLDFDDMLTMTLKVLNEDEAILKKYQNIYHYIQIDEAQDTSNIQHKIIEKLAHPKNNIFIVADDDQSIYGFRGANPSYLLDFKDRFKDAKIFYMSTNYRSTKTIVNASNNFIKQNTERYEKNLVAKNECDSIIELKKFNKQEEQYDFILDSINLEDLSDSAILYRNNISSIPIIDLLDRLGINFYMKEIKLNFFNNWIVRDIISFLNLIIDNTDKMAFEQVYYKMNAYISKKAMNFVLKSSENISVFQILENCDFLKSFQKRNIRNLGFDFSKLSRYNPYYILNYIENDLEYIDYIEKRAKYIGQNLGNLLSYFSVLKILAARTDTILDFLNRLNELKEIIKNSDSGEGLFLSTIHSAKGLEFKNVFIVDLVNGEFPSTSSIDLLKKGDISELEEERRIFYVGITRAKENLYLLSYDDRGHSFAPISEFYMDIDKYMKPSKYENTNFDKKYVDHKVFGKGRVLESDHEDIVIDFDKIGVKKLSKKIVLEKNLLK